MPCAVWPGADITPLTTPAFPSPFWYGDDGEPCIISDVLTFAGVAKTAFDEFRQSTRPLASVTIRLLETIGAITARSYDARRLAALKRQAEMLTRGAHDVLAEENDRNNMRDRYREILDAVARMQNEVQRTIKRG
jgi:uncharacterized membrane protein